ncbi:MAG: hypothetical protein WCE63_04055 [Acidobacteriaceae bacterium]
MATAYPPVAAECNAMPTPRVTKAYHPVRKLAANQRFAKLPSLSKAAAKRIARAGYEKILADTGSEEVAREYQRTMEKILPDSVSW